MKNYILPMLAVLALAFAACSTDETTVGPNQLEVEITPTWDVTRGMTSSSQTKRVAVNLNVQSVHWMVSSDSDWCLVDEEENHLGNGEFTVEVTANEDFKTRNAVVTISAGAFSYRVEVDQSGNIFILDRIYSVVASDDVNTFDVKVRTLSEWQPVDSEWIHGEVVSTSVPDADGMTESVLRIRCDANAAVEGRYGVLTIEPTDGVGYSTDYAVYQFGTGMPFDEEGNLSLPAHSGDAFQVVAPTEQIAGVACPTWITFTTDAAEDDAVTTYTFAVEDNPSDTKSKREGTIEFTIRDMAEKTLLPAVKQDFYPAGGIVTGAGLKMFAAAFNAGESIADWIEEGTEKTVQVLSDVDMTDVEWTAIGSEARPFDGIVVGNDHKILNWSTSQPLFGYLAEGSEVRNLTVDASSKVTAKNTDKDSYTAAFAGVCNGTLRNCRNEAMVTLDAAATVSGATGVAGVAGLVEAMGRVEGCSNKALITLGDQLTGTKLSVGGVVAETTAGSVVTGCVNEGAVVSGGATPKDSKAGLYTGGVVGYAAGTVDNCSTEGGKAIALKVKAAYMSYTGGVIGWANGAVVNCSNKQPVSITAARLGDACRYAYAGGIAGMAKDDVSGCRNQGDLTAAAICKFVIMGGIAGRADARVSDIVNEANVTVTGNPEGASGALAEAFFGPRYAYLGGVIGQLVTAGTIVGNLGTTNSGAITIEQMEYSGEAIAAAGGVAGMLLGKISDTANAGNVSVSGYSGTANPSWKLRALGGIAGLLGEIGVATPSKEASITGSSNSAVIRQDRCPDKANHSALPVYQGGIAGYILAEGCTISGCTNSGEVNDDSYNNNIEYGTESTGQRANCTAGIVGAAVSEGEANTISSCTNTGTYTTYRGMLGGVVGYVDNARITGCTNTGVTGAVGGNRNSRAGGIAAQAVNTRIEDCLNRATVMSDSAGDASKDGQCKVGGIVGVLGTGSALQNCRHFGIVNQVTYGKSGFAKLTAGGVAGVSVSGTEISNCGFGGQIKGNDAEHTFDMKLDNACSDKNFTASAANYLWDGK